MYNSTAWYSKDDPLCCDLVQKLQPSDDFHNINNIVAPYDDLTDIVTIKVGRIPNDNQCSHDDNEEYYLNIY